MLHSKFKLYLALIPNLLRIQVSAQKIEYLLQLSLFYVKPTISLLKSTRTLLYISVFKRYCYGVRVQSLASGTTFVWVLIAFGQFL